MPIYEYACSECEHRFSLLQPISATEATACPQCGEKKSRRLFSTFSSKTEGETTGRTMTGGHSHTGGCGCG